jgi:hypothetical protein
LLPPSPKPVNVSLERKDQANLRFNYLMVTTLERLLIGGRAGSSGMKLFAVTQSPLALIRAVTATIRGRLGHVPMSGVHVSQDDLIRIEGDRTSLILDGEEFFTELGRPILLRSTGPVPFLRLAA